MELPQFDVAPEVRGRGLAGCYGLLLDADQTDCDRQAVADFVNDIVARAAPRAIRDKIVADPVLAGFHALHRAFDVPTRKLFSAPENLFRHLEKRGDLPRISPLVDLYNAISLESGLALGAHDIDRVDGDIHLRLTDGSENFHPVGASLPEPVRPGEYAYLDDANDILCRLEVRQVEKTKVTEHTRNVFLIVQGNSATPPPLVTRTYDRLTTVLKRFLGGRDVLLASI